MKRRAWLGGLAVALLALQRLAASQTPPAAEPSPPAAEPSATATVAGAAQGRRVVVLLTVDGGINPATAEYINDGIDRAVELGATAVVIELDTPGGLLDSTKVIVKALLGAPVPTIVYVAPSGAGAISAGVFITMAANIAAMAPGTNIGAAHPVSGQGESIEGDMGDKVENFAASLSRTIAQKRGRNVDWAEEAVRESVSVTEVEAVELNVVDLVAPDLTELLLQVDGREVEVQGRAVVLATAGATIERVEMRLRQKILNILANPNLAYLLMMAGILGLYVEFTNPGVLFPGIAGAICLLLALAALQVLPINYSGLALIVLGLGLLVGEAFLPSFGILGIGGIVSFVLGSLLLFDTPESTLVVDRGIIAGAAATLGTCILLVGWLVVRAHRRQPAGGAEGMIGEVGEVRRVRGPSRKVKVFVHGEYWDASVDEPVGVGDTVEVVAVDGLRMSVRRKAGGEQ